ISINKKIKFNFKDIEFIYMRKILKVSFDVFCGSALSVVYTTFVPILINISLGDKCVGVYILVEKILSLLKQMFMPIIQAFYAKICLLYSKNEVKEVNKLTDKILILYFCLTATALLFNIAFGEFF